MKDNKKGKVLLAMSGGLDSSVAAILLQQQGYNLVGITFKPFDSISRACAEKEIGCCNTDTLFEAKELARKLNFEHHIIDAKDTFNETVIKNFISEYMSGRTPNPCVVCNKSIKWGVIIDEAKKHNCDFIATGHYARIGENKGRFFIKQGIDTSKDQSYFLWMLEHEVLKKTIFPLGEYTKTEVREIARANGFSKIADKKESQEVCFITDNDYRRFLSDNVDNLPGEGNFVDLNGKILGKHKGFPFYTIGQRKGLQIALGEPVYVVKIIAETNTIVLGKKQDLACKKAELEGVLLNKRDCSNEEIMVK
ncbi:MAG: tRNA 2-thiouridine(34) synthase MnmA, partial [Bacteroidales bacterium]|nr:tRNA 2-thiouridine(34) synthase MnmA [Bacteroidales bacterium]